MNTYTNFANRFYETFRCDFRIFILMPFLVLFAGCGQAPDKSQTGSGPQTPDVTVTTLASGPVTLTTELPGRTSPYRLAEVRPQVSGVIQKRMFTEGGLVTEGQQLYQIDPAPYQAAFDNATAAFAHAQAVQIAAKAQADRYRALKDSNAISKSDFDTAISSEEQAKADIQSAQANLDSAKINLVYTKVLSPITGRTGRSVTEGALVTTNQATSLVTVQQLDPIYVDVPISTGLVLRYKREISSGQIKAVGENQAQVTLILEDGSKYDHMGTIQFAETTVDQGTGSVIVRAVVPNPQNLLLPGMFVTARLEEGVSENALLIPQRCVTNDSKGNPTVFVVTADNKVELRPIKTDRAIKDNWLVTDGLSPGEKVIVEGIQKVQPGMVVHPTDISGSKP